MTSKTTKKTVSKELPERVPDGIIPLAAMQCLAELSETLRKMRPKEDRRGAAPAPTIVLTSSGMELRFTDAEQASGIPPAQLAAIEEELKALRQSTAALQETVAKNSRAIEKTLESHSAAIGSIRAGLSQNEELVEGIVETLQMLNGGSEDRSEEPLAAAS
jgi:hypothetical protein